MSLAALSAVVLATNFASPASATVTTLQLQDHIDASIAPPPYGLRLDGLFGEFTTFSVEFDATTGVDLVIDETAGTMQMVGRVFGGEADPVNDLWIDADYYDVDMTWNNLVVQPDGWVIPGMDGSGTIKMTDGTLVADLTPKADDTGNSMLVLDDDHRDTVAGDGVFSTRGWVMFDNAFNQATPNPNGFQDWIVLASPIPEPGSLLVGAGLLGLGLSRRRMR